MTDRLMHDVPIVPWSRVQHTADRVAIIATGPSLRGVKLAIPKSVTTIAVNGAIDLLPEPPDFWITTDPSALNRKIMANQNGQTVYYAAVPPFYGDPTAVPIYFSDPPEPNVIYLRRIEGKGPGPRSRPGLSRDSAGVHVGNSGYGALGLAYLMGAKRIALLGIDGQGKYAHISGRPRHSLHFLGKLFATAADQLRDDGIEVRTGSLTSLVKCWPRIAPQEALEWLA